MPNPLEGLKKATSISSGPSELQETAGNLFSNAISGLRGALGFGDDTQAAKFGELLSAGAPFLGAAKKLPLPRFIDYEGDTLEHPAITHLMDMLSQAPEPVNPDKIALGERLGSYYVPHRALVVPPEGFEFPPEMGQPWISRNPAQSDRYVQQRSAFAEGGPPPPSLAPPKIAPRGKLSAPVPGFESKLSTLTPEDWAIDNKVRAEGRSQAASVANRARAQKNR